MDFLDRLQAKEDEARERLESRQSPDCGSVAQRDGTEKAKHVVIVIGCIRGVDGWYKLGFDEETKRLVPIEKQP